MDHDSRRRPQEPGAAVFTWRAGGCDKSLGLCGLSHLAEVLHRSPMGPTGCWKNLRTKWSGGRLRITIERMVQDGVELAELLSKRLQKDRIVLVGHSWGSALGVFMAKARPDLFYAFVGTGQVADPTRNYAVAYAALVERASREGNSRALQELNEVGPPPYKDGRGFAVQRKWSNLFEGADVFLESTLGFALVAPGYSLGDINDWFEGHNVSAEHLVPRTSVLDPKLLGGEFAVPVFVIQGAEDFTTPTSLAKTYLNSLHAPRKAFATIEGAGHFAVFTKQDVFLNELRTRVLPLIR